MEFSEKAVVLKAFGSYNCLSVEKFPLPPLDDLIEVEVEYCGVNFVDLYTRQGLMQHHKLPMVLGTECVGVIKASGCSEEEPLKVGERVICFDYNGGLFRNILRISPLKCYRLPDDIPSEQGAAIFVNYLTAYFALFELGGLKPYSTVFVSSCAGGVGCAVTQLAKTLEGVVVVGTASESKHELVKKNGVDHVLHYETLQEEINDLYPNGFDVIIDNQAAHTFNFLQTKLKQLGKIILIGSNTLIKNDKQLSLFNMFKVWWQTKDVEAADLILNNRCVSGLHLGVLAEKEPLKVHEALEKMFSLLRTEKIKPIIYHTLTVEEIVTASKILAERKNVGKVLLTMKTKY
ncbi:hypothetical protein FQA39_LY04379 [Lamprigera yunnana]|nr:hypothetical protein FQA39_LY04379 [Lamprigera yunnana]